MKDGKRSKATAPKIAKKASGQKTRSQNPSKSSAARPAGSKGSKRPNVAAVKGSKRPNVAAVKGSPSKKSSSSKTLPPSKERSKTAADAGTNGREKRTGAAGGGDVISFTNPVIATAFKRAIKKYPTAFKHLTD